MSGYLISDIGQIIGRSLIRHDTPVTHLLVDSRRLASAEGALFFAIEGERHDGHRYISDLYEKGVRSFVVSEKFRHEGSFPEANFIFTTHVLQGLQALAAHHRSCSGAEVVAITGSNGKTIVKEWLYHCLSASANIVRSPKSYNSQVGVPLSLWLLQPETEFGLFEAGISKPGEMLNLEKMVKPGVGIFTNIGEAHQENFVDLRSKVSEKLNLFLYAQTLIYCKDHVNIDSVVLTLPGLSHLKLFTWSFKTAGNINIREVKSKGVGVVIEFTYLSDSFRFSIPFSDNASVENAMHVAAFLVCMGLWDQETVSQLESLPAVAMRLELKKGIKNCTIINDSYNSDINALSMALDMLNMQTKHQVKTLILSDILQSGMPDEQLYTRLSRLLQTKKTDKLIAVGPKLSAHHHLFSLPAWFYNSTAEFIHHLNEHNFIDEAILIKGSRVFEFERISTLFEEKKHLTRLEINLDALTHNLNIYRGLLSENIKIMVMVKALAYGSGAYEIASLLQFQRVDYLGVAFADEGVELRQAGISLPIMVMSPEPAGFDLMIQNRLEPELFNFSVLRHFSQAALRNQEMAYPVHIKIDTGMHRLGFVRDETDELCRQLARDKGLKVISVFSHFAAADESVHDTFTEQQLNEFLTVCEKLQKALGYSFIKHMANSSAIERFSQSHLDMVRLGIGLYGFCSSGKLNLRNTGSLKSTISQVKILKEGDTIGYGLKGKVEPGSKVATIPIGYADGLNRHLGNGRGKIMVRGAKVPIVGNICMDMCMVDLSGTDATEGDEVVIFGDGYHLNWMAQQLNTIPYEILTGISSRVERVYYHE